MALPVLLTPLTSEEQREFISALAADYVDFLMGREDGADVASAWQRAQAEIEAEVEDAIRAGEEFWAARTVEGATAGWLWVKHGQEGLPPNAAFLYQILVRVEFRQHGNGTAMLAAVEEALAKAGWGELRLNVWDSNEAAQRLYDRAGYERVERLTGKRQLRKRLLPADESDPASGCGEKTDEERIVFL